MRYSVFRQQKNDIEPRSVFDTDDLAAAKAHAKRIGNLTNWVYVYDFNYLAEATHEG